MVMREASSGPGLTAGQLLAARALSLSLSLAFAALLIYTIAVDGSPFRQSLLTPWMSTTLVDYYLSCAPLYAVVWLREARGGGGGGGGGALAPTLWVVALAGLGACSVWFYVFVALMRARPGTTLAQFIIG